MKRRHRSSTTNLRIVANAPVSQVQPFAEACAALTATSPSVELYLAHQTRSQRVDDRFFGTMADLHFDGEQLPPHPEFNGEPALKIWRFRRRA